MIYPRFARIANMSTSINGKKVIYSAAAATMAYVYAQECKNDVIFFTKSKFSTKKPDKRMKERECLPQSAITLLKSRENGGIGG